MDTDTVEGNNSLCANRQIESYGNFSGYEGNPFVGQSVTVITGNNPHQLPATVTSSFIVLNNVFSGCISGPHKFTRLSYQIEMEVPSGFCFTGGDSGGAVLSSSGELIAIFSSAPSNNTCIGYAQMVGILRASFGLDGWYGINTSSSSTLCN
jgi:hypothetical protein